MSSRRARRPPRRPRLRLRSPSSPSVRGIQTSGAVAPSCGPSPATRPDLRVELSLLELLVARRPPPPSDSRRSARFPRPTSNPRPLAAPKSVSPLARHRRVDREGPELAVALLARRRRGCAVAPLSPADPPRDSKPPSSKTRDAPPSSSTRDDTIRDDSSLEAARALPDGEDELVVVEASDALDAETTSERRSGVFRSARRGFRLGDAFRTYFSRPGARVDRKGFSTRAPRWRITARRRTPRTASPRGTWCWWRRRTRLIPRRDFFATWAGGDGGDGVPRGRSRTSARVSARPPRRTSPPRRPCRHGAHPTRHRLFEPSSSRWAAKPRPRRPSTRGSATRRRRRSPSRTASPSVACTKPSPSFETRRSVGGWEPR